MVEKIIANFNKYLKSKKYLIFHYSCSNLNRYPIIIGSISLFDNKSHKEIKFSRNEYTEREIILNFLDYITEKVKNGYSLIGWNINKEIFGIKPLYKRLKELTGKNHEIEKISILIFDIDEIFKKLFPNFRGGLHNLLLFNSSKTSLSYFISFAKT